MIRAVLVTVVISTLSPWTAVAGQVFNWGQDIRWAVTLEQAKGDKDSNARQIVVKVDLRKSPFRKVEKAITKIAFFDAADTKIGEKEFQLGDGKLKPGTLHVIAFPNPHPNATSVKGIELRAIIDGETYVDKPFKKDGTKIAVQNGPFSSACARVRDIALWVLLGSKYPG